MQRKVVLRNVACVMLRSEIWCLVWKGMRKEEAEKRRLSAVHDA